MSAFDVLADAYDVGRLGYSNELYDMLVDAGLKMGSRVLDVGCGTGLASAPLVANGFNVTGTDVSAAMLAKARAKLPDATWQEASAEALPFQDASFDVAISAQAFHWFDRPKVLAEMMRVVRPAGLLAIWWKHLMKDDPVRAARQEVTTELGLEPKASGLTGGFREFYAAPLGLHQLRVIPWRASVTLERYLAYERSRANLKAASGADGELYFEKLEALLRARFGEGNPTLVLSYMQYLYLGTTR